ncbi:hypothetical protein WA556_002034, partial [Blastocystis sp. ATCC 50177/Nand II]
MEPKPVEWISSRSKAISVIHCEDDIQVYMRGFAEQITQRMRDVATKLSALQTQMDSCEYALRTINGNIRELNQEQTVVYRIKSDNKELRTNPGIDAERVSLLPAALKDYSSVLTESEADIIRSASRIPIEDEEEKNRVNSVYRSISSLPTQASPSPETPISQPTSKPAPPPLPAMATLRQAKEQCIGSPTVRPPPLPISAIPSRPQEKKVE